MEWLRVCTMYFEKLLFLLLEVSIEKTAVKKRQWKSECAWKIGNPSLTWNPLLGNRTFPTYYKSLKTENSENPLIWEIFVGWSWKSIFLDKNLKIWGFCWDLRISGSQTVSGHQGSKRWFFAKRQGQSRHRPHKGQRYLRWGLRKSKVGRWCEKTASWKNHILFIHNMRIYHIISYHIISY